MIPKKIHYCWFGNGPLPELAIKCISSWKKYCPDYEIIQWDESNYDVTKNKYMKDAYDKKKWGFVPDYARLDIVYSQGGFYLDTDVELIKGLDDLCIHKCYMGVETPGKVALGLGFGAEPHNEIIKKMLEQYENLDFINEDGSLNLTPSPVFQTELLKTLGFERADQKVEIEEGCIVFPKEYFNPTNMDSGRIIRTNHTYSIHHYAGSWVDGYSKFRGKVYQMIYRFGGEKLAKFAQKIFGRKKSCCEK